MNRPALMGLLFVIARPGLSKAIFNGRLDGNYSTGETKGFI